MFWRKQKPDDKKPERREPEGIMLYAEDDRLTRAKKIVHLLGYRGAVGGFVLTVEDALRAYEELDAKAAVKKETADS